MTLYYKWACISDTNSVTSHVGKYNVIVINQIFFISVEQFEIIEISSQSEQCHELSNCLTDRLEKLALFEVTVIILYGAISGLASNVNEIGLYIVLSHINLT